MFNEQITKRNNMIANCKRLAENNEEKHLERYYILHFLNICYYPFILDPNSMTRSWTSIGRLKGNRDIDNISHVEVIFAYFIVLELTS